MDDLTKLSLAETSELLARREISAREVAAAYLDRIEAVDSKVKAYINVNRDLALTMADEADRRLGSGQAGPLTGAPIGIKDVICIQGLPTTCGSRMLENFVPPYDATVIKKLKEAGAVFLGKLNMDEFAMGSSTENSAFHPTFNPWDLSRIPGGSSGGSAAAVAARTCVASLGSDTGGSIRQPASHCGVVGMKPTYGRVSRFGLVAFASSLDQIGPLTRDVRDCALLMEAICGHDPSDSTSAPREAEPFTSSLEGPVEGIKVGVPREYFADGLSQEVAQAVNRALDTLRELGCELVEVELPHTKYAVATYYIIAPAEASSNLSRYDGVKYGFRAGEYEDLMDMYKKTRSQGFGPEVKRRIMIGTYALSSGFYDAYYRKASQVRTLIKQDFQRAFEKCDVIAGPVAPTTAFKIGEKASDPLQMYLSDIFTIPVNLAGVPGLSVPCGVDQDNLPVGLQLVSNYFREDILLKVAYNFERARGPMPDWPEP